MRLLVLLVALTAWADDFPAGQVIDSAKCLSDPSQTYALYLPRAYSSNRTWPVILAFDPGARGRVPVERYQAPAETYGYIVAGSNNSRNGSWEVSTRAAQSMMTDIGTRFAIDPARVYTAGMSGGARVALGIALGSNLIAGVIATKTLASAVRRTNSWQPKTSYPRPKAVLWRWPICMIVGRNWPRPRMVHLIPPAGGLPGACCAVYLRASPSAQRTKNISRLSANSVLPDHHDERSDKGAFVAHGGNSSPVRNDGPHHGSRGKRL